MSLGSKAADAAFEFVEKIVFTVAAEHNSVKIINKVYQVNSKSHCVRSVTLFLLHFRTITWAAS